MTTYNIERSNQTDKEMGILWEDIKVTDSEGNFIIFRKYEYNNRKQLHVMHSANILDTKFYNNDGVFTKIAKGKTKKIVDLKISEFLEWIHENIKDIKLL